MKTKEQVLNIIEDLLIDNNTIVTATLGNGGAGLTNIMLAQNIERINSFIEELNNMKFEGAVEPSEDIQDSDLWINDISVAYQFSDNDGFKTQVLIDETYDVQFDDSENSSRKGFSESYEYCKNFIEANNGGYDPCFMRFSGGTISIVNDEGVTVYSEPIKDNIISIRDKREQVLELLRKSLEDVHDPSFEKLYDKDGHLNERFDEMEGGNGFDVHFNKQTSDYRVFDPNHWFYTGYTNAMGWSYWASLS